MELSVEALAALKELALERGILGTSDDDDSVDNDFLIDNIRKHFDIADKSEIFRINKSSSDSKYNIQFEVKGYSFSATLNSFFRVHNF